VFSVDDVTHYTYQPEEYNSDTWPFDAEQFLLLNFAFLPETDPNFVEDALEIDYVRVYQNESILSNSELDNQPFFDLKNIPNPAHNSTIISYTLSDYTKVKLLVHDISGRLIHTLVDENQTEGQHQVQWDLNHLSAGTYFYTLQTENNIITKKCIIDN